MAGDSVKYKTQGKGEWHIVELTPEMVMKMASRIYSRMSKGQKVDECYWNETLDDKFQIRVKL
jgi:hypothetical protein